MKTSSFVPHAVECEDRADGSIHLRSKVPLGSVARTTGDWLEQWAAETPDAIFIAERSGAGWRALNYRETLQRVQAIGGALVERGLNAATPIIILSGNSVDHGLLALAAQYVGIPAVPVAEAYSLIEAAHPRLVHAIEMTCPAMAFVDDAEKFAAALNLPALDGVELVASHARTANVTSFASLCRGDANLAVAAHQSVGPGTVAKILMTSGSTSNPKGVITTHGMMCTNQAQIAATLPFLTERPPRIVDWLPWNHVFGGSHNFNMMLAHGGALYIDDGKPAKGPFERTVENLKLMTGTAAFNVPVGFGLLLKALEVDPHLRRRFFTELDLIFYAGASLPQEIWQGLERMALEVKGELPVMTSSWGLTETAPACLMQHEPVRRSGVVGVPLPGVAVKLLPDTDLRCEIRVKGPNVMPGYWQQPEQSAAAFDDEGYFITGDAMLFVDPSDTSKGLKFDGRICDDFKLLTGTWVRTAGLRLAMLEALSPLAQDLVITGADRDEVGMLIIPHATALAGFQVEEDRGVLTSPSLKAELATRMTLAAKGAGSSTRVARALVTAEPPSLAEGEITAKGNLNNRKYLSRRPALLARLYDDNDPNLIRI